MKKFNYCLLLVLGFIFGGQPVSAATYTVYDYASDSTGLVQQDTSLLKEQGDEWSVDINYSLQSNWVITSAEFFLLASDDDTTPNGEKARVMSIEGSNIGQNVDLNSGTGATWYLLNANVLSYLLGTNSSPFTSILKAQAGDFNFLNAKLVIEYTVVPIPAAIWLFGSALLGLMGFTHRKRHV
jgi:hypothetical protein